MVNTFVPKIPFALADLLVNQASWDLGKEISFAEIGQIGHFWIGKTKGFGYLSIP